MINNVSESGSPFEFSNCTNADKSLAANVAEIVLNANTARRYSAFVNNSSMDITLILGDKANAAINKGIILKPHGGSYEINSNNLYIGSVSAMAANNCKLSFVECIK